MVFRISPTPAWFPINIPYTMVSCTRLHSISSVRCPMDKGLGYLRPNSKNFHLLTPSLLTIKGASRLCPQDSKFTVTPNWTTSMSLSRMEKSITRMIYCSSANRVFGLGLERNNVIWAVCYGWSLQVLFWSNRAPHAMLNYHINIPFLERLPMTYCESWNA